MGKERKNSKGKEEEPMEQEEAERRMKVLVERLYVEGDTSDKRDNLARN